MNQVTWSAMVPTYLTNFSALPPSTAGEESDGHMAALDAVQALDAELESQRRKQKQRAEHLRNSLDRAQALRTARQANLWEAVVEDPQSPGMAEPPATEPPQASEAEIRKRAADLLAEGMAAPTPVTIAKAARWRKTAASLRTPFSPKEEAALGGKRTGDRVRVEEVEMPV